MSTIFFVTRFWGKKERFHFPNHHEMIFIFVGRVEFCQRLTYWIGERRRNWVSESERVGPREYFDSSDRITYFMFSFFFFWRPESPRDRERKREREREPDLGKQLLILLLKDDRECRRRRRSMTKRRWINLHRTEKPWPAVVSRKASRLKDLVLHL